MDAIHPNPRQPRQHFDDDAQAELVHSVREIGLLQPVVVRAVGDDEYELVMGERRWRAVRAAGLDTVPAIVRDTPDDAMLRDALLENLHRSQLNPLEEAAAYQQLLDDFGCTHEELAGRIGRSRPQITNTLRLLRLSPPVQRRVAAGVLSAGHARALVTVDDPERQDRLAAADGRRGPVGPRARGGRRHGCRRRRAGGGSPPPRPAAGGAAASPTWPSGSRSATTPGSRSTSGKRKGRISVEFASLDDLERIVEMMDPRADD